jgi:DNA primase
VLIPDNEDPDSYVNTIGASGFIDFVQKNKKDFILFQLELALGDIGNDPIKKSELVNKIAESISRINKAEDFTKQQDYIKKSAEILTIDEAGLHALVNKYIRDRITVQERKATLDAKDYREANAVNGEASGYDDATFELLHKDQLQEKELARVLLEYGNRIWEKNTLIAQYILEEISELIIEDADVNNLLLKAKELLQTHPESLNRQYFIYHDDKRLSSFAVSLLNYPYEESERWKDDMGQELGYQKGLFAKDVSNFLQTISEGNEKELRNYKLISEDRTPEKIISAIQYLKLKKIKRMILENQKDIAQFNSEEKYKENIFVQQTLKEIERNITKQLGTVIVQ